MANNHSTLTGLFTDIANAIREKTGTTGRESILPEIIIDAQEDNSYTNYPYADLANYFIDNNTEIIVNETYVVTIDSVSYRCIAWSLWGEPRLGNSAFLAENTYPDDGLAHEDVPFLIDYFLDPGESGFPGDETLYAGITLNTPGNHNIKIEKFIAEPELIIADNFPEVIAAIDTQEDLDPELSTQDDLITQIATALEGKMGAGPVKTTKTINLDWSMDEEWVGQISYVSNGQTMYKNYSSQVETIEAEGGAFYLSGGEHQFSSNTFISIDQYSNAYLATQDGETIYFVSSRTQQ